MVLKKRYFLIIPTVFLFAITSLIYLRDIIIKKNNRIINNIYFELPFILKTEKDCKDIDLLFQKYFDNTFSATIIDHRGNVIGSFNDNILRIPASNIKLFSTSYVIDNVHPSDTLQTSLYKDNYNNLYLIGSGDPDLTWNDIRKLLEEIEFNNKITLNLLEVKEDFYWPDGWTYNDKNLPYGAPLSLLALDSNQNINNDINYLQNIIYDYIHRSYPASDIEISILYDLRINFRDLKMISTIYSNNFLSLITLANSLSHNYTAEILYKNISRTWGENNYKILQNWLIRKGLPIGEIIISDASGLSRDNLVTTKAIALFLYKMQYNNNFEFFKSSLSILGVRGTLSDYFPNSKLKGIFFGKTGTLSNSFALSGYLYKDDNPIVISIIQNSIDPKKYQFFDFLLDLYELESYGCL